MTMETLAWLGMVAYAAHILEEYTLDWRNWARGVLGLPVEWSDFYVTNCIVLALGVGQGMLAPTLPLATLSFSGLMLINAVLMHITPFIRTGGRFSPGLVTAVAFFVPLSIATFRTAWTTGLAGIDEIGLGLMTGGLTLAFPIVMLLVKSWPYFRQDART